MASPPRSSRSPSDKSNAETAKCACTAILKSKDGKVYTLAPTKLGKELGDIKMHEQYVRVKAQQMPGSQILAVESYEITKNVEPKTPEPSIGWYNL